MDDGFGKRIDFDKATGFHEAGDGLMVIDWLMEPGSDEEYGDEVFAADGNSVKRYGWYENKADPSVREYIRMAHGSSHRKRMVEGPQLCHRMKPVQPEIIGAKISLRLKPRRILNTLRPEKKSVRCGRS